jgi:hypothetical protein
LRATPTHGNTTRLASSPVRSSNSKVKREKKKKKKEKNREGALNKD